MIRPEQLVIGDAGAAPVVATVESYQYFGHDAVVRVHPEGDRAARTGGAGDGRNAARGGSRVGLSVHGSVVAWPIDEREHGHGARHGHEHRDGHEDGQAGIATGTTVTGTSHWAPTGTRRRGPSPGPRRSTPAPPSRPGPRAENLEERPSNYSVVVRAALE